MIKVTHIGRIGLKSRCPTTQLNANAEDLEKGQCQQESPEWLKHCAQEECVRGG